MATIGPTSSDGLALRPPDVLGERASGSDEGGAGSTGVWWSLRPCSQVRAALPVVRAVEQIVGVCPVGLAAAGLGKTTAHHVADTDDCDEQPGAACRERIHVRPGIPITLAYDPRRDQDARDDRDHRPELCRLERVLRLGREP